MAGATLPKVLRTAVGIRLRAHRKASKIRQDDLARRAGVVGSQISRIEKGQSAGSVATLLRLAWALRIEPSELIPDAEEITYAFGKR